MKKVLLFGALGAVGCLFAWALGEVFLKFAIPWANALEGVSAPSILTPPEPPQLSAAARSKVSEQLAVPTPAPPPTPEPFRVAKAQEPPPTNAEFAQRLEREGAHKGDVEIALIWWNTSDLDLHVVDPAGEEIYYSHKKAQSSGELDVDMNVGSNISTEPVEHVYFPQGGAPGGHYRVSVVCFTDRAETPNQYKVEIKANGERRVFEGSITNRGNTSKSTNSVCEFDVEALTPELRVSLPENVAILPNGSNDFRVRIARGYFDEPVMLRLDGGSGLTIDPVQIPKGETVGTITLHASSAVTAGQTSSRLAASAETPRGHVEAAADLRISVVQPPKTEPVLKIAVPSSVQVLQGDSNRFKVRVGRYFFAAPLPVTVQAEAQDSDLKSKEIVVPATGDEALMEVKAAPGARPGKHDVHITASATSPSSPATGIVSFEVIPRPLPQFGWAMVGVVALWTALLAVGLSLALVVGQNHYLGRQLLSFQQCGFLLFGGALAGAIAGGGGQMLLAWLGRMQAGGVLGIPSEIGQVAGWCLLGILLGYGVAFYIPNLSASRAAVAGGLGALVGVGGFLALTHFAGEIAGRVAGATILGFAIGCMVAIVEVAFREAWLEIQYGPKESRTVTLGLEPISIGSNQSSCTVYAKNTAPVAYRYWLKDNSIFCEDVSANRTSSVAPGDRKQIGNLVATVCAVGAVAQQTQAKRSTTKAKSTGLSLRLATGQSVALGAGAKITSSDILGLHSVPPGGPVAQVNPHPTDPNIQGLQNLSHLSWRVHLPNGDSIEVKPGKNVRLVAGTRINFGSVEGSIHL